MQVLENAVRKLKMPVHAQEAAPRVEPRFTTVAETTPVQEPIQSEPVMSAVPPPPPRAPLFSELPDPQMPAEAPVARTGGGSGGGGASSTEDDDGGKAPFGPILTWVGGAAAIALVLGVSVWTYRLGQRDAMEVPIVAALEGPARVAPDEAGGRVVAHQGYSVNEVLEGQGVAAVASRVTTAPSDNDITAEDPPQRELTALLASRTPVARPSPAADGEADKETILALRVNDNSALPTVDAPEGQGASRSTPPVQDSDTDQATIAEVKPQEPVSDDAPRVIVTQNDAVLPSVAKPVDETVLSEGGSLAKIDVLTDTPVSAPQVDLTANEAAPLPTEGTQVAALGPFPPVGEGSSYAPAIMKMPRARPADLNVAMANAVNAALEAVLAESTAAPAATPAAAPVAQEPTSLAVADNLDVIPLPTGTRMIQLGAYDSEAVARQQWDRLSSQHDDLLGAKAHYVQRTENSGKTFYRLRVAGYQDKGDTRSACAALSARGLPCITVTLR